jgi:predicted glutamine amidotransferase
MCGITGLCFGPGKDRTEEDYSTIRKEFTQLLVNCQVRGRDAAGAFVVNKGPGNIYYYKAPKTAAHLTKDAKFLALLDQIGPDTIAVIGHTRAATTGSPRDNANNHPIIDGPIIGVHNGVIRNHWELGGLYSKVAKVDSAAIMALLRDCSMEKPLTTEDLVDRLPELEGSYAIAVADARKPNKIFLARNNNPICMTRNYKLGYLAFASTGEILRATFGEEIRTFLMPAHSVCRIDRDCMKKRITFYPIIDDEEEWTAIPFKVVKEGRPLIRHRVRCMICHYDQYQETMKHDCPGPSVKSIPAVTQTKMDFPKATFKPSVCDKGRKCGIHGKKNCHELNHPLVRRMRIIRRKR